MTATSRTHGSHCSHAAHGLSERSALAYLSWPLMVAAIYTVAQAQIVLSVVQGWF